MIPTENRKAPKMVGQLLKTKNPKHGLSMFWVFKSADNRSQTLCLITFQEIKLITPTSTNTSH
jgi:hypothetical protein